MFVMTIPNVISNPLGGKSDNTLLLDNLANLSTSHLAKHSHTTWSDGRSTNYAFSSTRGSGHRQHRACDIGTYGHLRVVQDCGDGDEPECNQTGSQGERQAIHYCRGYASLRYTHWCKCSWDRIDSCLAFGSRSTRQSSHQSPLHPCRSHLYLQGCTQRLVIDSRPYLGKGDRSRVVPGSAVQRRSDGSSRTGGRDGRHCEGIAQGAHGGCGSSSESVERLRTRMVVRTRIRQERSSEYIDL